MPVFIGPRLTSFTWTTSHLVPPKSSPGDHEAEQRKHVRTTEHTSDYESYVRVIPQVFCVLQPQVLLDISTAGPNMFLCAFILAALEPAVCLLPLWTTLRNPQW